MELIFGGRLGSTWASSLPTGDQGAKNYMNEDSIRKFVLVALERRVALCVWNPHPTGSLVWNPNIASLSERRKALDDSLDFTEWKNLFIFTSVSSAADLIHCKSSNGNELFTVSEKGNRKLKNVRDEILAMGTMSVASALQDMPNLKSWIVSNFGGVESQGWGKRLNAASMSRIAKTFFSVSSPLVARIGRLSDDDVKVKKEQKKQKPETKKRSRDTTATTTAPAERVTTAPAERKRQRAVRTPKKKHNLRAWLSSICNHISRVKNYLDALNHPYIQAVQSFRDCMPANDYDKDDWQSLEADALLVSGLGQAPEYQPPKKIELSAESELKLFEHVWSELQGLPQKYHPDWLTEKNFQILHTEFVNMVH
jgi:hypothetical protein